MSSVSNTQSVGTGQVRVTMAECLSNVAHTYAAYLVEREAQTQSVAA